MVKKSFFIINKIVIVAIIFVNSSEIYAQSYENRIESENKILVETIFEKFGSINVQVMDSIYMSAQELYNNGEYQKAIASYHEYIEYSSFIMELVYSSLEPFYKAEVEEKEAFPVAQLNRLVSYERRVNEIRVNNIQSLINIGKSYFELGDTKKSIYYQLEALEDVKVTDISQWLDARGSVLYQIGM